MSYDGIEVKYASLQEVEDNLRATAQQIVNRLDRLEEALKPIDNNDYEGIGREQFQKARQDWDSAMNEMIALIGNVAVITNDAQTSFRNADMKAGDRMSQIRV